MLAELLPGHLLPLLRLAREIARNVDVPALRMPRLRDRTLSVLSETGPLLSAGSALGAGVAALSLALLLPGGGGLFALLIVSAMLVAIAQQTLP